MDLRLLTEQLLKLIREVVEIATRVSALEAYNDKKEREEQFAEQSQQVHKTSGLAFWQVFAAIAGLFISIGSLIVSIFKH